MHEASKPGILGHLMILRTGILEYFEASRINKKKQAVHVFEPFFYFKKTITSFSKFCAD